MTKTLRSHMKYTWPNNDCRSIVYSSIWCREQRVQNNILQMYWMRMTISLPQLGLLTAMHSMTTKRNWAKTENEKYNVENPMRRRQQKNKEKRTATTTKWLLTIQCIESILKKWNVVVFSEIMSVFYIELTA